MTPEQIGYMKAPETAVIEGLSSALANIDSQREESNLPDLNLTDEERLHIIKEITYYITSRFNLEYKP